MMIDNESIKVMLSYYSPQNPCTASHRKDKPTMPDDVRNPAQRQRALATQSDKRSSLLWVA